MLCNSKNGSIVLGQSAVAESLQSSMHNADVFNNVDGLNNFCHNVSRDVCNHVYHDACYDAYFLINSDNLHQADGSNLSNELSRSDLSVEGSTDCTNEAGSPNTADSLHELSLYTAQHKDSMDAVTASLLCKMDRCPESHILTSVVKQSSVIEQVTANQAKSNQTSDTENPSGTSQDNDTKAVSCVAEVKLHSLSPQVNALENDRASVFSILEQSNGSALEEFGVSSEKIATSVLASAVNNAVPVMTCEHKGVNEVEKVDEQELSKRVDSALEYVSSLVKFQLDKHQPLFKTLLSCKSVLRSLGIKVCKVAPKNLRYLNFAGSTQPSWAYALSSSNSHDLYWVCGLSNDDASHGTKSEAVSKCVALGSSVQDEATNLNSLDACTDNMVGTWTFDSGAEQIADVGTIGASADSVAGVLYSPAQTSDKVKKLVGEWTSESAEFQVNTFGSQTEVAFDPNLHHHNIALVGESNSQGGASSILSQAALGMANLIGLPIYDAVGMETFVNRQCQESADHLRVTRSQTDGSQSDSPWSDCSQSDSDWIDSSQSNQGHTDCSKINSSQNDRVQIDCLQNTRAQSNCSYNKIQQKDVQQSTGLGQTHCIAISSEKQTFLQKEQCMAQHKDSIFNRSSDALLKLQSFNEFLAKKYDEQNANTAKQQNTACDAEKLTSQNNPARVDISKPQDVPSRQDLSADKAALVDKTLSRSLESKQTLAQADTNMQDSCKESSELKAFYGQRKSLFAQDFGITEDALQRRNFAAAFKVGDLELVFQKIKERSVHQEWLDSLGHTPIVTRLALHICCRWIQRRCKQVQMLAPHEIQDSETEIYFDTVSLLIQTMTFAMRVDESINPQERQALYDFCLNLFGSQITNIRGEIDRCLTMPLEVNTLVNKIHYPEEGLDIFMLSAVILDGCGFISEGYLESLAACLKIDPSLQRYLHYRAQNLLSKGAAGVDFKELDRLYVENLAGVSALESR